VLLLWRLCRRAKHLRRHLSDVEQMLAFRGDAVGSLLEAQQVLLVHGRSLRRAQRHRVVLGVDLEHLGLLPQRQPRLHVGPDLEHLECNHVAHLTSRRRHVRVCVCAATCERDDTGVLGCPGRPVAARWRRSRA